eukprot:m.231664 g.231664  ORF g.231664 m.231664 type:complete len:113 (+) comp15699_c1_seq3:382-720(+)
MLVEPTALPSPQALALLHKYCVNIQRDPANPKFRRIRVLNKKFHKTVWSDLAARTLLVEVGFVLEDTDPEGPCVVLPIDETSAPFASAIEDALVMHEARASALAIVEALRTT